MLATLKTMLDRMGPGRDLALAGGVIAIIAMLVLPMPGWLLDFGLALSIAASVLILMTALFIEKPLQLSSFPTILLIVTMLRLGLNIASTRLILGHGHEGHRAAGGVIGAFGEFLMGGETIIGLTIFMILIVINFVVITKGAGRIAEVGARFSLDAMPGKQMAIDADLSSGMISETEARERRSELEAESGFYGAMDGASKFVKGDAIAALVITGINILVGLTIGVLIHGVPFGEAFRTYTILTAGEGLVSQIPALIVSIAAAGPLSQGLCACRGSAGAARLHPRPAVPALRRDCRDLRLARLADGEARLGGAGQGTGAEDSGRTAGGSRRRADCPQHHHRRDPHRTGLCAAAAHQ